MPDKKRLSNAVSTALGFLAIVSFPTYAQDDQSLDEDELILEEVIVTGTRLALADGFGQTSPVTVVGMEDISASGLTRVEDVLNNLPQIASFQNSFFANGSSGTATLDMRDLGPSRTLVLFNGRRMQPGGVLEQYVDVNQIPTAMIERVEVLTGGASATYGGDAVAGVVNFIMRRVTGVEVSAGISAYQHDNRNSYIQGLMDEQNFEYPTGNSGFDGKAYNIDIVIGGDFDNGKGNATVYAAWRENEELKQEARDYSSCALDGAGTACGGSGNSVVPNFFIAPIVNGEMDWFQYGYMTLAPDSSLADSVDNRYNYNPVNHFMRPDERWSIGAFIDYEISPHAISYLETNFASDRTEGQIAESGTFFADQYTLPLSNSLFPEAFRDSLATTWPGHDEFGIYIGKRNVEGGPRTSIFDHKAFRIVTGLKGVINDNWDYDVSYLYASTSSSQIYINDFLAPRIAQAVNGELCALDPACIPYEVFTYQGVTKEQADNLTGVGAMAGKSSTEVINGYVTGDLKVGLPSSADTIMMVAGFELREEKFERNSDVIYTEGTLLGQGGAIPSLTGDYSVKELFLEANVPLLSDKTFARSMTLDLAYRWSDYSTAGRTDTYRAGLVWQTVDWLRVRTGYNRAVRIPNPEELFFIRQIGTTGRADPCWGSQPTYTFEQCARTGVTPQQYGNMLPSPEFDYFNVLRGGNPELGPETADTVTFGLVIDATDTLRVSFDYWDIKIEDVIGTIGSEVSIDQCALFGQLCHLINRAGNGSLWLSESGYVDTTNLNLGGQHYSGIDVALDWSYDALGGKFGVNMIGSYWLTKETTLIPNDPNSTNDCVGLVSAECLYIPTSKWRHSAGATYDSYGFWVVTGRWRYYSKVEYEGTLDQIVNDNLAAQSFFDLNAVFRFMGTHDVVIGVNNLFDKEPPLAGNSLSWNGNTFAGLYDTLGRYLFANVTLRW
jgi:outer membrane receptor protein involved in Fe transport